MLNCREKAILTNKSSQLIINAIFTDKVLVALRIVSSNLKY